MSTILYIGIAGLAWMIVVLAIFADDIAKGQKELRENFIRKRKMRINKLSLGGEVSKDLIKKVDKGFFTKRKESVELLIHKSDMHITYGEYLIIAFLCGIIGWFVGKFFNNIAVSIVLAVLAFSMPKAYLRFVGESFKRQIGEQLEPTLSQIIGLLPSKKTLINACESCLNSMDEPLKTYFTEFVNNINNANRSFEEAINDLARKIDSKPFYDFARLAIVHYRQGGDTMYAFSSIPEAMRDIKLIQSEQEAELDSLKLLGYMFTLSGPLAYVYYYFTDKASYEILVNTTAGKIISFIALVITIITVKLVLKISKPVEL